MNKLTQIFGAIVIVLIALVFILQFQPAANTKIAASSGPGCAVEIQGDCISPPHFWAAYRLLAPRGADADQLRAMGLRRRTADGLIERWLLNQDAKRLGITVSEDELTTSLGSGRAYVSLPVSEGPPNNLRDNLIRYLDVENRQTKKFDRKSYERQVRVITQLSPPEFREFQRQEMIAARMRDLIRSRAHVGEAEAFALYAREKSTAALSFVKLDARFYQDIVADRSPKAVETWAEGNKDEIEKVWGARKAQYTPECRVAKHIFVPFDGSDEDKAEARKKIDAAIERVKKGDDFAAVARTASQDEETKPWGGDLGCVGRGKRAKPFEDALFALGEGKVSDVVETEQGYHVIKVEKVAKDADAEKIGRAEVARELYLKHEGERLAAEAAKQMLAAVRGGKSLDDALKSHLDAVLPKPKEDKKGDKKAAAKDDKKAATKDDKAAAKDDKAAANDEQKPENDGRLTAENHPYRPVVETSLPFNSGGRPISDARPGTDVAKIAFELEKVGDVPNDVVPLQHGYAVIQLREKTPAAKEQWEKDRDGFIQDLRNRKEHDVLINYVKRLRSSVEKEIKITQSFITESKEKGGGPSENEPPEDPGTE